MKLLKYMLPIALATCGFSAVMQAEGVIDGTGYSSTTEARESLDENLAEFVKSKGMISLAEKGGSMMLSGDVRTEWTHHFRSRTNGHPNRGPHSRWQTPPVAPHAPFPKDELDIEVNLMFDYRTDRTWSKIRLQFDNPMGIRSRSTAGEAPDAVNRRHTLFGSGVLNNIVLRQGYFGYNLWEQGTTRVDVELGRRRFYDAFDSRIQGDEYFDGVLLRGVHAFEGITDFKGQVAGYVIDRTTHHYGWISEVSFLNIVDTGVDFKYSYNHWNKHGQNRFGHRHPRGAKFGVNQFTLAYNVPQDWIKYKTQLYGAFLFNGEGHRNHFSHHERANKGWYAGAQMGEIRKQNDWAIDANYQWVEAQAIPESDVRGIGRDNPRDISFYRRRNQGFANYKGYKVEAIYALTDNITLDAFWESVRQESHHIGGKHRNNNMQLAAIYAF